MKTVCVYHSIDLDGWMSAAIVKHWFEQSKIKFNSNKPESSGIKITKEIIFNTIDFIGYNYGDLIPDLSEYDQIIMCDISFSKEEMLKLVKKLNQNFIIIDHHKTCIDIIKEIEDTGKYGFAGILDTKFAACELTWKYFMSNPIEKFGELDDQNPMPEIVRLLGRYDCFGHKGTKEHTKVLEFQYGARSVIGNYEEAYDKLLLSLNNEIEHGFEFPFSIENLIEDQGKNIYRYLCIEAEQVYKTGFEIHFYYEETKGALITQHVEKFICINRERFNPINFNIDYHKNGYDGTACFYFDGTNYNFSLYNDNNLVDCSLIAKQYGGDGHKGASGFRLTPEQFNNLISK